MIQLHYPKYRNLVNMLGSSPDTFLVPLRIPITTLEWPSICNPSIYNDNGTIRLILRNVNYILHNSIDPYYCWSSWGPVHYLTPQWDLKHLKTRNWICEYKQNNILYHLIESNDKEPIWDFVGLEDARLVRWNKKLYAIGVRRDDDRNGKGRMEMMEINEDGKELSRTKIEVPWESYCEKNWVPIIDMPYHFIRTSNPTMIVKINPDNIQDNVVTAEEVLKKEWYDISRVEKIYNAPWQKETLFRGSSQVIPYKDNTHIALVHTCELYLNEMGKKVAKYLHHFILWDDNWNIIKISPSFSFNDHNIEFSNGLMYKDNKFYIPFALQDSFSYLVETSDEIIDKLLDGTLDLEENFEFLPNASIYYNDYNGFKKAEQEADWCVNNGYFAESYCRYWRMYERSKEFPISPERQIYYLLGIINSLGWGVRDDEVYNVISLLENAFPGNPEILIIIAKYFYKAHHIGMARSYLYRAERNMDEEYIFHFITKKDYDEIVELINNEDFWSLTEYKEIERIL